MRDAIIIQLLVVASLTTGLYTAAANWFSTKNHNVEMSGYLDAVNRTPDEELELAREQARNYNSFMPQGVLRDPYTEDTDVFAEDEAYRAYKELLRVTPSEAIGRIRYPAVGVSLPIYHGTSDEVLRKGVGHLYGSSLPIGGPGTHTVLTAHSGLVNAELFTPMLGAAVGDEFSVEVLGETHWYRVGRLETVLPNEAESLRIVPGEDQITLVTCTPIGVNTHRLLVNAARIAAPTTGEFDGNVAGNGVEEGFPWWIVGVVGGSAITGIYLFAPRRGRAKTEPQSS